MRTLPAVLLSFMGLCGCQQDTQPVYRRLERPEFLPALVGKYVEIVGTVSNSPVPQISGVDLWGLEQFQGQQLRVRGILQCMVILRGGDTARGIDSGSDLFIPPSHRGPGTYYRLQSLTYEVVPKKG